MQGQGEKEAKFGRRELWTKIAGAGLAASGLLGLTLLRFLSREETSVDEDDIYPSPPPKQPVSADAEPTQEPVISAAHALYDYSIEDAGPRLAIVEGGERVRTLRRLVEALGGMGRFVRKGDRVLVKPNVGFATPPEVGATTHPTVVRELVRLCFEAGASEVLVTDYPTTSAEHAFRVSGIARAAEDAGARVVLPDREQFRRVTLPSSRLFKDWPMLVGPLSGINRVIGVAPVKDHGLSGVTLSIKNWYGLLGGRRNLFHQRIVECLVDLATLIRPTLVILDATVSMVSNGPTGGSEKDLKRTNTMIGGLDPVAVDACGAALIGRSLQELPWLIQAEARGLGTARWEKLNPIRDRVG